MTATDRDRETAGDSPTAVPRADPTWPPPSRPRVGHAIARLLGIDAAYALFCPNPCCTDRRTSMTENSDNPTGAGGCNAALNIKGEHFWCDMNAPHVGFAHSSADAEAIWFGLGEAETASAAWAKADPDGAR